MDFFRQRANGLPTTLVLRNKGWTIRAEQINFIEQQEVNEGEVFQIPLLLKAVNR